VEVRSQKPRGRELYEVLGTQFSLIQYLVLRWNPFLWLLGLNFHNRTPWASPKRKPPQGGGGVPRIGSKCGWYMRYVACLVEVVWHDSFTCVHAHLHVHIRARHITTLRHVTRLYVCHDSFISVLWLVYMCDVTHVYIYSSVTWLTHMCDVTDVTHVTCLIVCVTWLMWRMWRVSCIWITCHMKMCDMTQSCYHSRKTCVCVCVSVCVCAYVCGWERERETQKKSVCACACVCVCMCVHMYACECVRVLLCMRIYICTWVTSHIWMSHVTHMNESRHTCEWATSHIGMSHVTHMHESRQTYEWVMSHKSHELHLRALKGQLVAEP